MGSLNPLNLKPAIHYLKLFPKNKTSHFWIKLSSYNVDHPHTTLILGKGFNFVLLWCDYFQKRLFSPYILYIQDISQDNYLLPWLQQMQVRIYFMLFYNNFWQTLYAYKKPLSLKTCSNENNTFNDGWQNKKNSAKKT